MKPPTSEDVTRQLQQAHFPQKSREQPANPIGETAMVVTLEQLRPYELNPRVVRNPLYDELKASIRERGLDHPPSITRRPNEQHFIIRNGGNTRLSILGELWQETREERFFRLNCLYRPWQSESHALLGHLAESDLHGQLTFIERALAVAKLLDMFQQPGEALSQRELATRLSKGGYPISQSHISRMFDALEFLLPSIPQVLYAGLGKPNIERVLTLRRRAESTWNQYLGEPQQFALLWMEVLSAFDDEKPELDASDLQDELIAKMAVYLNQSPRVLALDIHQDSRALPNFTPPMPSLSQQGANPSPTPPADQAIEAAKIPEAQSVDPDVASVGDSPNPEPRLPHILQALGSESSEARHSEIGDSDPTTPCAINNRSGAVYDINGLRERCAELAQGLATYADADDLVLRQSEGLGFNLSLDQGTPLTPRHTGIQLLLSALLRLQDDVAWAQRQQLPAALFGQLLIGAYDLPFAERPALTIGLERLPDEQLEQLFALIRHARQLIDTTLSTLR
ncbi:chromosome partitioning protein ParB [Pseudomonas sp. S31]|uniref:ParB family protein n=1 Tax=Pseudomonas sp. S31 TaxID=1564473 RepID=UPI00191204E2|nr:ParB family protein [Pseudomonas sp. S31]MBK4999973.1 chromosome partitioning protein ParB [Pseudomonas sp. S31]